MAVSINKGANGWIVNRDVDEEFEQYPNNTFIFKTSKEMYEWLMENVGD